MATAESVKAKIQSLITKANTATGRADKDMTSAVNALVSGYGGGGGELPTGYRRADYIQFTGEELVDTGLIGNQDTRIQLCFTRENSNQRYLFGCASADNTAAVTAYLGGTWRFGNKYATKTTSVIDEAMAYFAYFDKTAINVTGSLSDISGVNDFETIGSILLGGCRSSNGGLPTTLFIGKVFFFYAWKDGAAALKLVPVTDGSTFRFFDMVSKTFFDSITDAALGGGDL